MKISDRESGSKDLHVQVEQIPPEEAVWHAHRRLELTLILDGSGIRHVGDSTGPFQVGDLVLLGKGLPHCWSFRSGTSEAFSIHFQDQLLMKLPDISYIHQLLTESQSGLHFAPPSGQIVQRFKLLPVLDIQDQWVELIAILNRLSHSSRVPLSSQIYATRFGSLENVAERKESLDRWLVSAMHMDLSVNEIAERCAMTEPSFCRWFTQEYGHPFVHHLNQLRVNRASKLLEKTDQSVSDIAFEVGFGSISNFNRFFKRMTTKNPGEYRRINKV